MLKYHCALVAPICLAIQFENGASKSLRKSKVLSLAIDAVKESIQMFEQQGFQNEAPHNIKLLGWPTKKYSGFYLVSSLLKQDSLLLLTMHWRLAMKLVCLQESFFPILREMTTRFHRLGSGMQQLRKSLMLRHIHV